MEIWPRGLEEDIWIAVSALFSPSLMFLKTIIKARAAQDWMLHNISMIG